MDVELVISYCHRVSLYKPDIHLSIPDAIGIIPIGKMYSAQWMKGVLPPGDETFSKIGCCPTLDGAVMWYEPKIVADNTLKPSAYMIRERATHESFKKNPPCARCNSCVIIYLNKMYRERIEDIRKCVFKLILCLKQSIREELSPWFGLPPPLITLIGKAAWNSRYDMKWRELYDYRPATNNK